MRIVVKIGTSSLCDDTGHLVDARVAALAGQLTTLYREGHEIVLVSSAAVGAGIGRLGRRPASLKEKQATAAIGQVLLMNAYQKHLGDIVVAQVLLTRQDLENPDRRHYSHDTLNQLLSWRALPIVNENDTVAVEEFKIGDNDTLAARVAVLLDADQLVLLSDIDGLYTENPRINPKAQHIERIEWVKMDHLKQFAGNSGSFGTGGMGTKLEAAMIAQQAGIPMVLAYGLEHNVLIELVAQRPVKGTRFMAQREEETHAPDYAR